MRRVRHLAAEFLQKKESGESLETLAECYFLEIKKDLSETRALHPAQEQTAFVFDEIDNRWQQLCRRVGLGLNPDAFMSWAHGKDFSLLEGTKC